MQIFHEHHKMISHVVVIDLNPGRSKGQSQDVDTSSYSP
jgi:hypothetical protein